jgi:hypothetical protein
MKSNDVDTLGVFYYVLAGITGLQAVVLLVMKSFVMSLFDGSSRVRYSSGPFSDGGSIRGFGTFGSGGVPPLFETFFVLMLIFSIVATVLLYYTGLNLRQRTNYVFIQVIAALTCFAIPIGTALGVFTFIALRDEDIRSEFGVADRSI